MTKFFEYLLVALFAIGILLAAASYLSPEVLALVKSVWLTIKTKINSIIGINTTISMVGPVISQKYLG